MAASDIKAQRAQLVAEVAQLSQSINVSRHDAQARQNVLRAMRQWAGVVDPRFAQIFANLDNLKTENQNERQTVAEFGPAFDQLNQATLGDPQARLHWQFPQLSQAIGTSPCEALQILEAQDQELTSKKAEKDQQISNACRNTIWILKENASLTGHQ